MEVATTNNHHHHNQPHHHLGLSRLGHQLHHPAHRLPMAKHQQQQQQQSQAQKPQQQQQNNNCLTVSTAASATAAAAAAVATDNSNNNSGSPRSPFQREVREWQRIDPDTGALLSGRLEADRWINGPLNSYGKISDSQNISQPNGTQHTQRKQLEVLQKRTANGAVQVIRAQTVQTTSSRSWSSSNSNSASTSASASASASPICMTTNNVGGGRSTSILHNHNSSSSNNNINNSKHFHNTLQQHLAEANTHWLQLSPPTIATTVDISEVSTDDDLEKAAAAAAAVAAAETAGETPYIVDDGEIDDDDGDGGDDNAEANANAEPCNYSISRSGSGASGSGGSGNGSGSSNSKGHILHSNSNNNSAALLSKPLPLSSSSSSLSSSSKTLHSQSSALILHDTAPSLKLSNLMKSSSGGSTSSSSNNSTTMNTHPAVVGKVSLHTIVGGDSIRTNNDTTKSPKSTTKSSNEAVTGTKTWQPHQQQQQRSARHLEQATLYGQNSNSSKTRVGVADCDDCYAAGVDADESPLRYQHQHQHRLRSTQQQQQQQQPAGKLSETTPTRRRDLESFRHYGVGTAAATATFAADQAGAATATFDNTKDDDLRLSTRQLRRQQQPFGGQLFGNARELQRSHSISTDDLSNEWETNEAVAESNEWRRVSKLRRSFQSSSSTNNSSSTSLDQSAQQQIANAVRRPYDLPASSVSVSRIRAELESGRRLTTAMRNNHVDLAALESILHGPEKTANDNKRNTLLTAESLKEIRGRLKKLSDESLYKDDFIAYQQPPAADEHIEVQQSVRRKVSTPRLRQLTPEQSPEISTPTSKSIATTHKSAFKVVASTQPDHSTESDALAPCNKHTSHSLETRQKSKDTSSTEWHSRRKSYGFEKMSPPDSKSMFRMDASTDSGLGRSGELGNWSPTESAPAAARATVIHFGEPAKTVTQAHYRAGKSPVRRTPDEDLLKRHSIAVDESQYVRDNLRKTSQVHLNGFYEPNEAGAKSTLQLSRYDSNAESNLLNLANSTHSSLFQRTQNAHKRVEFCKTEVHFAAESGRVNIVETDGKPPPTNNFRRRRRTTSGPLQTLTKSVNAVGESTSTTTASNITHFGDDREQRHRTIASSLVAYKATLMEPSTEVNETQVMPATTNVTVSVQRSSDAQAEGARGSYASTTSGVDTTDNENDEIAAIRGILKNKPVKPKPYHLGENIDSADALWGVQLKPVGGGGVGSGMLRDKEESPSSVLNKSVAERVRIVEKRHEIGAHNGYSTKINLNLDEPAASARDWPSADLPKSNIMSIELHSPQISLEKRDAFKRNQTPPMAKPRTTTNVEQQQIHIATSVKQTADRFLPTAEQRESLRIVKEARGARKLREHELSYFGIANAQKHEAHETRSKLHSNTNANAMSTSKRTLPARQRLTIIGNDDETKPMHRHEGHHVDKTSDLTQTKGQNAATKWQLLNDKPDLLRHSPIAVEPQLIRLTGDVQSSERNSASVERKIHEPSKDFRLEEAEDEPDDHYYENITNELTPVFKVKSPQPYDRKMDVERDAYILSEMNENADLTMKALSDEAAHKDRRRRRSSLHRRDSKPLETIEEKMITHKPTDTCIAVKMSRGTLASEAKRSTSRHTASSSPTAHDAHTRVRTSSQSSVESSPRARSRSRSLSSEREYENIRTSKPTRSTTLAAKQQSKITGKQHHRSSSRESQRSARLPYSSGDEVTPREEQRVRMKSKRCAAASSNAVASRSGERRNSSSAKQKDSTSERHRHHHQSATTANSRDSEQRRRAASSTTHASQREERAECVSVPPEQQRTLASSGRRSSSKRREEQATHAISNTAVGSSERHSSSSRSVVEKSRNANAGVRLFRSLRGGRTDDAKAHSMEHRASGHGTTSEREKLEREKEKQSKSRGHSTSKTQHHHSSSEHQRAPVHSERVSSKTHERKSTTSNAAEKSNERATTPTHSKSSQVINGRRTGHHAESGHHKHSDDHSRSHTRHSQHDGATTTSTQVRKRSEHSRRERK